MGDSLGVDVAAAAEILSDRARVKILLSLLDNRQLPASRLAHEAGVAPSTASAHLQKLVDAGFVRSEKSGRHRFYGLADDRGASLLEVFATIAQPEAVTSLRSETRMRQTRAGRTCYDHLAGELGVAVTRSLVMREALSIGDGGGLERREGDVLSAPSRLQVFGLGPRANDVFADLGVDLNALLNRPRHARVLLKSCLDWTEQQHHLAGALGAAVASAFFDQGWVERRKVPRAVALTDSGSVALSSRLDLDVRRRSV